MNAKKKQVWIEAGYQMIADQGYKAANVGSLARVLEKNKSSFYHYFGDWERFEEELLAHHLQLSGPFSQKINACETVIPGMIHVFLEHKTDLFFHKQLRINRSKSHFKRCFEIAHQQFIEAIHDPWIKFLGLEQQSLLAIKFLTLISENLLLQITDENYNYDWLREYMMDQAKLLSDIKAVSNK
ncbi:MAG: TetR/AcrR family transcriptional regulator [Bacteroidota bacterium]